MASDAGEISRLILDARRNLVPLPFPPRRDLDVAALETACDRGLTLFHDIFWPRQDQVAGFVVRIDGGEAGSLLAHALRALLRAGLRSHAADEALALSLRALERAGRARIDAAAATLSLATGEASLAYHGAGMARLIAAQGGLCWLSVGEAAPVPAPLPPGGEAPDAHAMVRAALAGTRSAAALAIGLRSRRADRGRTFVLANDVAEISPILAEIEEHLLASGTGYEALPGLDVALDEILTNIVLYAYRDGQAHEIVVRVALREAVLCVEIRDDGTPFDPTAAPPPDLDAELDDRPIGGLGLHLVRAVFDTVAYRRAGGWNVLALTKPVPAGTAALPEEPHA